MSLVGEIQEAMTRLIMVQLGNERGEGGEDGSEEGDGSSMKGGGGVGRGQGHGDPNVPTLSLVERLSIGIICKSRGVCDEELGRGGEVALVTRNFIFTRVFVSVLVCLVSSCVLRKVKKYNKHTFPFVIELCHRPRDRFRWVLLLMVVSGWASECRGTKW